MPAEFQNPSAINAVADWLDGAGAAPFCRRAPARGSGKAPYEWVLEDVHPLLDGSAVRLTLPRDYPVGAPRIGVNKALCLKLPHVEGSGNICLDLEFRPSDFDRPTEPVRRAIQKLQYFLSQCEDEAWVHAEFQRECASYWSRFCDLRRAFIGKPFATIPETYVDLGPFSGFKEAQIAIYPEAKKAIVSTEDNDPHRLASRYRLNKGTMRRGNALVVNFPPGEPWKPTDWPRTLAELEEFVARMTDHCLSVTTWWKEKLVASQRRGRMVAPAAVLLVQQGVMYGYLIFPSPLGPAFPPSTEPLEFSRIDADWALARDYRLDALHSRRSKRVLLLGCGSLGSPVAEILARAGIGKLSLVDFELFESENTARHVLGMTSIDRSKVYALQNRLQSEVPGIEVKAAFANAGSWITDTCKPNDYEVILDCTGESSIRVLLSRSREYTANSVIAHAWMEPFGAAAHVVSLGAGDWPNSDPADSHVNAFEWPNNTRINLPACGAGFHAYAAADAWQAAGFVAERVLSILDGSAQPPIVWSWIRSRKYVEALPVEANPKKVVPDFIDGVEATTVRRTLSQCLGSNGD